MDALETLQWATRIAFVALAAVAVRGWVRTRHRSAGWLAATFVVLATVVIAGLFTPDDPRGVGEQIVVRGLVVTLLLFPYLLFRFAESFGPGRRRALRAAAAATAALVVVTLALPDFPSEGEARPGWFTAYVVAVLVVWVTLSVTVAHRLWRAGTHEPRLARRRMRLLGVAGLLLAAGLVVSGASGGDEGGLDAVTQLAALASAGLFLIGYAPPAALRLWWRRHEVEELTRAELALMEADSPEEILGILLPRAADLVGARHVTFEPEDSALDLPGPAVSEPEASAGGDAVVVPLRSGRLVAWTSPYAPVFGDEEIELLRALGVVAGLALERSRLFVAEKEARREAERSNTELEQFAYAASHDLKAPLAVIAGLAEILVERHRDDLGDGAKFVDTMFETAVRMAGLIDDLLRLSRIGRDAHVPEPTPLSAVVDDALANLGSEIERTDAQVTVVSAESLPPAMTERSLAVLIVQNLVGNALKYAGDGVPQVTIAAEATNGWVTVEIADRGEGIDPGALDRIFVPFVRLRAAGDDVPGNGIGLAIVKKAVEVHGGEIEVESQPGEGTTFRFTLPAAH